MEGHEHHNMGHEHHEPTVTKAKMWNVFLLSLLALAVGIGISIVGWMFIS